MGDLRKLGARLDKLVDDRREVLIAEHVGDVADTESARETAERRKAEVVRDWQATAQFQDGDDEVEGPISDVLDELDRRSTAKLTLKAGGGYFSPAAGELVRVTFKREAVYTNAVELEVQSRDPGWARQALTLLSEEVEKGVPRWAKCRTTLGRTLLGFAAAISTYAILMLVLPTSMMLPVRLGIAWGVTFIVSILSPNRRLVDWLFPPFEITSDSGSSTGGRRIAALIALILSVPVGIIVNRLSG